LKSSMPTKKQNVSRKLQNKNNDKRKFIIVGLVVSIILIIILYLLFNGSSVRKTNEQRLAKSLSEKRDEVDAGGITTSMIDIIQMALTKAKLQIESSGNKDILRVVIERVEKDSKEIMYKYEWFINNQPVGAGGDSISGFKRGDKIAVKITPFSDDKFGQSRVLNIEIQNTTPKISEGKELKYDGKVFSYQVGAVDPDGDTLLYTLVEAPPGMTIDAATGILNWQLKEGDYGTKQSVKVRITDGKGGEIIYPMEVTPDKQNDRPVPKK
jgi:hypothetical protein